MREHVFTLSFHAPMITGFAGSEHRPVLKKIHRKTKSMMENQTLKLVVANTSVRMKYIDDSRQRKMLVLLRNGMCRHAVCTKRWNYVHRTCVRLLRTLLAHSCQIPLARFPLRHAGV